jgi:hypothetical protein
VLRLGSHPSRATLFAGEPLDAPGGRTGIPLSTEQLELVTKRLTDVTEDMGAVVRLSSRAFCRIPY